MRRSLERKAMSRSIRFAAALIIAILPAAPSLAQAPGYVRVNLVKAGLMLGTGGGNGVLTYRGRDYPFRVSGPQPRRYGGRFRQPAGGMGRGHQAGQRLRRHL